MSLKEAIAGSTNEACLRALEQNLGRLFDKKRRPDAVTALRAQILELGGIEDAEGLLGGIDSGEWGRDEVDYLSEEEPWQDAALALVDLHQIDGSPRRLPDPLKAEIHVWQTLVKDRIEALDDTDPSLDDCPADLDTNERKFFHRLLEVCEHAEKGAVGLSSRDVTRAIDSRRPILVASILRLAGKCHRFREEAAHDARGERPNPFEHLSSEEICDLVQVLLEEPCVIQDLSQGVWALGCLGIHAEEARALLGKMLQKVQRGHTHGVTDLTLCLWSTGRLVQRGADGSENFRPQVLELVRSLHGFEPIMAPKDRCSAILGLGRNGMAKNMAVRLAGQLATDAHATPRDWATAAFGLSNYQDFGDRELARKLARHAVLHRECPGPAAAIARKVLGELHDRRIA